MNEQTSGDGKIPSAGSKEPRRISLLTEYTRHPDDTVNDFLENHRHESAVKVVTRLQILWYMVVVAVLLVLLNYDWLYFLTTVNFVLAGFYLVTILYKLITVALAAVRKNEVVITPEELAALKDEDLPVYTVLVPLYKEPEVTGKILQEVESFDYPEDKLDIKILLEADDEDTLRVCLEEDLPDYCEIIIVPDTKPKTKPRACNHGLKYARGEFLVIYDAEDRPEHDQLKKAVAAFKRFPDIPCFQSKLNYFNPHYNYLTRWFTVEYTAWFDLFLPGLHTQGAPIPLGGTSNHFRIDILKEVGGWDPFNVTEDADLGIRLHKRGYRTQVLDSTTWEEANSRLPNWINQRSRWIKGYIQTHLVHMRNPVKTLRDLGPWGFASFIFTVGGMAFMMLLNPLYWIVATLYGILITTDLAAGHRLVDILADPGRQTIWNGMFSIRENFNAWQILFLSETDDKFWSVISIVFFAVTCLLLISNIAFILINFLGARRRNLTGMTLNIIFAPIYWMLISVAAWKGFLQLFYKPFYWEKTTHGYNKQDERMLDKKPDSIEGEE